MHIYLHRMTTRHQDDDPTAIVGHSGARPDRLKCRGLDLGMIQCPIRALRVGPAREFM